jgi:hypothetical protein
MALMLQLVSEIRSMFAGDWIMSVFAIVLVLAAIAMRFLALVPPPWIGFGLVTGCVALLVIRVLYYARHAPTHRR